MLVFAFAFVADSQTPREAPAGILWVTTLFAGTLALARAFDREHANQTLSAPTNVRCEAAIENHWGSGSPAGTLVGADNFSVRWERTLNVADGQRLRITAGSDDGIRVYLDGNLVVNDWVDRGYTERLVETGPIAGGNHQFVVEYYENGGGADAVVRIEPFGDVPCADTSLPWSASYWANIVVSAL